MNPRWQWIVAISALLLLDAVALCLSNGANYTGGFVSSEETPLTISRLYNEALLGEEVYTMGTVSKLMSEYTSKKGLSYQQFVISDGQEEIEIFCTEKFGKTDVFEGEEIVVKGTFQKYQNKLEIYGSCFDVKKI